jgi:multidrug efflux pump subunit AcrA (membrane-fusion protein)
MSTDTLPEAQSRPEQRPAQGDNRRDPSPYALQDASHGRWWKLGLFAIGTVAVVASAAALILGATSTPETGPKLTHTITRGDLLVTVTEQGTLESSNNTEVKCKVRGFSTVTWVIPGGTVVEPGDELVRLDTKVIEENLSLTKTNAHIATATLERTKADVAKSEIAVDAYKEGRYRAQVKTLEKELEVAKRNLRTAQKMLDHSETLFKQGYVTELEVDGNTFTVTQAELELKVKQTQRDVLERYTRKMELETLNGNLIANKSKLQADEAGLAMDEARRDRAEEELENCVITAERSGLVIYPSAAAWKRTPDITEGATVRKDQVMLLMPDLSKMQVKVGIHESIIDRIKPGLPARVTLSDKTLDAKVSSVASVTRPAGWWTGNVVKYDTIIELPAGEALKPGMTAEVEVIMARHEGVLTIPVAAVVETEEGDFCWVKTAEGIQRRSLGLGSSNDVFIVVEAGLKEGDEVVLNPLAFVEEAQTDALNTLGETKPRETDSEEPGTGAPPQEE